MHRRVLRAAAVVAALALLPALAAPVSAATYVHAGQSIQHAIDTAPQGGTVVVERGTYRENLVITRSIRLIGRGAVLAQPSKPGPNPCGFGEGLTVGICVLGDVDAQFNVRNTVDNVRIEGFTVRGFQASGIVAYGASGFHLVRTVLAGNGGYGAFVNTSSKSWLIENVARGNGDAGLYIGDSPTASATVVGNRSYGNTGEGILWRDALGGRIVRNDVHGNCAGIFVLDTGSPGAGGNVTVALNDVTSNNRFCPGEEGEAPPFGGIGIGLLGARDTTVLVNLIRNNDAQQGSGLPGGGIVLLDTSGFGGGPPDGITVQRNVLAGNDPSDVNGDGTGTGLAISGNTCGTTNVTGAC
jgi:nitrous oxidase accessory protein NosD